MRPRAARFIDSAAKSPDKRRKRQFRETDAERRRRKVRAPLRSRVAIKKKDVAFFSVLFLLLVLFFFLCRSHRAS